jgi:hypothetical protein
MRLNKILIAVIISAFIAVVICLGITLYAMISASGDSGDMCGNTIVQVIESPDKQHKIVVFERNCGATTDFSTQISILNAEEELGKDDNGNVFSADSDHGKAEINSENIVNVEAEWNGNSDIVIRYDEKVQVFRAEKQTEGITISYNKPKLPKPVNDKWKHLNGNWVMVEFIDNVLTYKSIAKYRTKTAPIWVTWAFNIDGDSLYSHGLVYSGIIPLITDDSDTLGIIKEGYAFYYDKKTDRIKSVSQTNKKEKATFRRATGRLNDILRISLHRQPDVVITDKPDNLYQFFVDNLIAGTYVPVSDYKGVKTMILSRDGSVKGFKGFDTYNLHDFFGTSHPAGNNDALWFYDTEPGRDTPYKWQYSDSTFILTRMHRNTGSDMYHVGTEKYEFIKQQQ